MTLVRWLQSLAIRLTRPARSDVPPATSMSDADITESRRIRESVQTDIVQRQQLLDLLEERARVQSGHLHYHGDMENES